MKKQSGIWYKAQMVLKRVLDILGTLLCLVVLSPLLILIAIAIKIDSRGPVFFRHDRVGKDGKAFRILKFRTMVVGADKEPGGIFTHAKDPRVTRVGRFLRSFSLDELAQCFNVLKGELSWVGPRPTVRYQVERYTERQRRRLSVMPGITGWAQINGRKRLNWPERIELDLWYIDHWSIWLDLWILLRTPYVILFSRGGVDNLGVPMDDIARPEDPSHEAEQAERGGAS
jgi:exopolysaccharide biosynthesis polyprenyl glycosylphosphotransferase